MSRRQVVDATCPLCSADAAYYDIDYGERHYFKCPTCTKFIITNRADQHLRETVTHSKNLSRAAQEATKDNDDRVLEVRYQFSPVGLTAQVVEKSDYPGI